MPITVMEFKMILVAVLIGIYVIALFGNRRSKR